jgi:hypothetical protein
MENTWIYTSTDIIEVDAIVNNGNGGKKYDRLNLEIFDLDMEEGRRVQKDLGLFFNPSSYVLWNTIPLSERTWKKILLNLIRERQFVAVDAGHGIKQYAPWGK